MDLQSDRDDTARLTPQQLFAKCEENARVADRKVYERMLSLLAGELTFPPRLLEADPLLDTAPSPDDSEDLKIQKIIHEHESARYRKILELLKECQGCEARWILLALWLKDEGICQPFEFLPEELYGRLTREKRKGLRISIADLQHYHSVEAWKPYFESLLADRRRHPKATGSAKAELIEAGYCEQAVQAAHDKRAAIPAVCEWLASRSDDELDAPTIRNAHSRVSLKLHHKTADRSL